MTLVQDIVVTHANPLLFKHPMQGQGCKRVERSHDSCDHNPIRFCAHYPEWGLETEKHSPKAGPQDFDRADTIGVDVRYLSDFDQSLIFDNPQIAHLSLPQYLSQLRRAYAWLSGARTHVSSCGFRSVTGPHKSARREHGNRTADLCRPAAEVSPS